ncbi:unnamed protein product [Laminaria digitata]
MDRLDGLESALWEAHAAETRAAAHLETLELQQEQKAEEEALEVDLKQRVDRLREACDQRASTLRREHEVQLDNLDRAARDGGGSAHQTERNQEPSDDTTVEEPEGKQQKQDRESKLNQEQEQEQEQAQAQEQAQEKKQKQEQERTGEDEGGRKYFTRQPPPPLVTVAMTETVASVPVTVPVPVPAPISAPEMVDLRGELGRHLAVAHADGGRHLREATRVMRLIEEVEAQASLEAKARSGLDSLEKSSLRQKHAQAEEVQRDKHNRLLRSLERSRAEQLRLVSVRHHGALGRLTERRRDKNRRRKHELRERLAAAKGGIARTWKEHNNRRYLFLLGAGSRASEKKRDDTRENKEEPPLGKRAVESAESAATPAGAAAGAAAGAPEAGAAAAAAAGEEAGAAAVEAAAAAAPGGHEVEPQCQAGEVGELRGNTTAANAKVAADGGFVPTKHTNTIPRTPPGYDCDSSSRGARVQTAAPTAGRGKKTCNFRPNTAADTTSVQQKKKQLVPRLPARRQRKPRASSTANTTSDSGRYYLHTPRSLRCSFASCDLPPAPTANTSGDDSDLPELTATTTAALATTAFVSGAVGVLSEKEVRALAALGRGTPNDPRLLLVASRPPSSEACVEEAPRETRGGHMMMTTRRVRDDDHDDYRGKKSYSYHTHSDGDRAAGTTVRGRGKSVLDRAVDKLVPEMRAREEATRRTFGMASLL